MLLHLTYTWKELCRLQARRYILSASIAFMISFVLFPSTAFASNDFMTGELRVDLTEINLAHDYVSSINVGGLPTTGDSSDFTTGWLGIDLPAFVQVGFMTKTTGVRWFVEEFTSGTIQCFHGVYLPITGGGEACYGDFSDRATIGNFQTVELVTYNQGFWIARVYDQFGNALDVAEIDYATPTNNITRATVTSEEYYAEAPDPYILANFTHSHPKYFIGGTGNPFAEWSASDGTHNNYISPSPSGICPKHYYAKFNQGGDSRVWYAGSKIQGPGVCSGHMF
jgi:hypothetical protein